MLKILRIATRKSPLALWQAHFVKSQIQRLEPNLTIELLPLVTQGDIFLTDKLSKIGGKSLFTKELEVAMLNGTADIAVHSMKDVSITMPAGLKLACIMERANPFDAFVSSQYPDIMSLPPEARVGTASLRRQTQLYHLRPDLEVVPLRGNVNTRLTKLDEGEFDAIILAASGLIRLNMQDRIRSILDNSTMLPAAGQGALGIQCRENDTHIETLLAKLEHQPTRTCVNQERIINAHLGGNCTTPLAAYAYYCAENTVTIQACIALPDGSHYIRVESNARGEDINKIGAKIALELEKQGAKEIIAQC